MKIGSRITTSASTLRNNNPTTKFIILIPPESRFSRWDVLSALSIYLTEQMNCEIVGIERNPDAATLAQQHCSRVILRDLEKDAFDRTQGKFDVITFGGVLEHLVVRSAVLTGCRKMLRSREFILTSIPIVTHYSVRFRLLSGNLRASGPLFLSGLILGFLTLRTAKQMRL